MPGNGDEVCVGVAGVVGGVVGSGDFVGVAVSGALTGVAIAGELGCSRV